MLSFSRDPKGYIQDLLCSQSRDLKVKGTWGALDGRQAYQEDSQGCTQGREGSGLKARSVLPPR